MTGARRWVVALPVLFAAACAVRPADPFVVAERALARHDLASALQAYDGVPVGHARYPEARAAALAVERDMRQSHELVLQALLLRAEWRDREALAVLQRVRALWPDSAGVSVLIAATEQRLRLIGEAAAPGPAAPAAETGGTTVSGGTTTPSGGATASSSRPPPWPPGADPVALGLCAVETSLGRGNLEAAVGDLLELARRFPREPRVVVRLVRLLHQRALLRYGEGAVAAAIEDWRRVLELAPDHPAARQMVQIAEGESGAGH